MLKTSHDHCNLSFSSVFVKDHPQRPRRSYIHFLNLFLRQICESEFHIALSTRDAIITTMETVYVGINCNPGLSVCLVIATLCSVQVPSTVVHNESCLTEFTSCNY